MLTNSLIWEKLKGGFIVNFYSETIILGYLFQKHFHRSNRRIKCLLEEQLGQRKFNSTHLNHAHRHGSSIKMTFSLDLCKFRHDQRCLEEREYMKSSKPLHIVHEELRS